MTVESDILLSRDAKALFQVLARDDDQLDLKVREYKKRKLHKKTKSGCLTCKAKKVKVCPCKYAVKRKIDLLQCDESKPVCLRCQRNSRPCAYASLDHDHDTAHSSLLSTSRMVPSPLSTLSAVTVVPYSCPSTRKGTSSIHLMHHIHTHWSEVFHMPVGDQIISLFRSDPLVRNTMLALAACHLRHVSPAALPHRIAEHFQQSLALQQYQIALDTPREILGQSGVNSLLLSASLLNMLAFALPEAEAAGGSHDLSTSWVFSRSDDRLGWLAMQAGLRPLMRSMTEYLEEALKFLGSVLLGDEAGTQTFAGFHGDLGCVPEPWIKVFISDTQGKHSDSDIFQSLIILLAHTRNAGPCESIGFRNLTFLGKVYTEFRRLLFHRDARALWLFGCWLGLVCRSGAPWWCVQRAKRDYEAIKIWLNQLRLPERPGTEGDVWRQMMRDYELASPEHVEEV